MLKPGDRAPEFTMPSHEGSHISLSDFRGRKVLLWFFLEAGTPGCTLEGRGFRDHQNYFDENNIQVLGASFDSVEANAEFARKYDFRFPLLSDADRSAALAYEACSGAGAAQPERKSILIDEHGAILKIYDQVDPRDHPARVLADVLDT
ncbi:MAG TPA: peroxiredoxin [Candidatus Binataceae bacterium]